MRYLIIGPQASGKGTQAAMIAKEFGLKHISLGECLRQEAASGSPLGRKIKEQLDRGELVQDELVQPLVKRILPKNNFILDGYPRTQMQAQWLDLLTDIDKVIVLRISDNTALERIGGRRCCPKGHDYHIKLIPPKKTGFCDVDGLPLSKRSDDTSASIMKRLRLFKEETQPVIAHYKSKAIEINGEPGIKDVHLEILKALHNHAHLRH